MSGDKLRRKTLAVATGWQNPEEIVPVVDIWTDEARMQLITLIKAASHLGALISFLAHINGK